LSPSRVKGQGSDRLSLRSRPETCSCAFQTLVIDLLGFASFAKRRCHRRAIVATRCVKIYPGAD
jgi:hypothetical protein